jgi:hypothetical protein
VLAAGVGAASLLAKDYGVIAASVATLLLVAPSLWVILVVALLGATVLVTRIMKLKIDFSQALLTASLVFVAAGTIQALASSLSHGSGQPSRTIIEAPPVYLILMDGYPQVATLTRLGIDLEEFTADLEARGFNHYPSARSSYHWTHHTITLLLGGSPPTDTFGSVAEQRAARRGWSIPDGFVVVSPLAGHVTIPGSTDIGPGGINDFEIDLLSTSLVGQFDWVGNLVMDSLRRRLDRSLAALKTTTETRVFAHLLAPHTPFLYDVDGLPLPPPECWPGCDMFDIVIERLDITVDEWVAGIAGNLRYLNSRMIDVVDTLIATHPDAVIVLFSDHGGRFTFQDPEEWHSVFLAARTPSVPDLYSEDPRPGAVLSTLFSERILTEAP